MPKGSFTPDAVRSVAVQRRAALYDTVRHGTAPNTV